LEAVGNYNKLLQKNKELKMSYEKEFQEIKKAKYERDEAIIKF